jgi:hypothetical protein
MGKKSGFFVCISLVDSKATGMTVDVFPDVPIAEKVGGILKLSPNHIEESLVLISNYHTRLFDIMLS